MPTANGTVKHAYYTRAKFNALATKDSNTYYSVLEPDGRLSLFLGNTPYQEYALPQSTLNTLGGIKADIRQSKDIIEARINTSNGRLYVENVLKNIDSAVDFKGNQISGISRVNTNNIMGDDSLVLWTFDTQTSMALELRTGSNPKHVLQLDSTDESGLIIAGVNDPIEPKDAVNKQYADNRYALKGATGGGSSSPITGAPLALKVTASFKSLEDILVNAYYQSANGQIDKMVYNHILSPYDGGDKTKVRIRIVQDNAMLSLRAYDGSVWRTRDVESSSDIYISEKGVKIINPYIPGGTILIPFTGYPSDLEMKHISSSWAGAELELQTIVGLEIPDRF